MLTASLVAIDIGNSECVKKAVNSIVYLLFYLFFHLRDVFGHVWSLILLRHIDDAAVNVPNTIFALNQIACHPVLLTIDTQTDVGILIADILIVHECHDGTLISACAKLSALSTVMYNQHSVFLLLLFYPLFKWLSLYVNAHILP